MLVKSLARPTSRCHRTELIVSLERGVCSCAELQVFSCYRGWKEACQVTRTISTSRCKLSSSFFSCKARRRRKFTPFWKKRQGNMHHRMPPSKTGWSSLNMVIFSPVLCLVLDDPKQWVTTQEFLDQIHELMLEDPRISAKSIAEQLGISREQARSIIHEDLDVRKLSVKWVLKCLNTDQKCQWC